MSAPEFDAHAVNYASELNQALAVTGEGVEFYAEQRIAHLANRLWKRGGRANTVLDFGCGTGTATPYFVQYLAAESVLGVDVSTESLRVASARFGVLPAAFVELAQFEPRGDIDVAYCNGVFHHIPPPHRIGALKVIRGALRSGGIFAFWENNPWNPGTQWVMSHTPFDRDAIKISPRRATSLLRSAGFHVLSIDYLFYFPRSLRWLRPLERMFVKVPLGGQYLVLCRNDHD